MLSTIKPILVMSYKSILPKFLWKHILFYLPISAILKMTSISKTHTGIIADADWKKYFLEDRYGSIAIVRCNHATMSHFWLYALANYEICKNINKAFSIIAKNAISDTAPFIYYKIFIKKGHYHVSSRKKFDFKYVKCSIELIGSSSKTIIYGTFIEINLRQAFTMSNITFHIDRFNFTNYDPNKKDMLYISKCIFEKGTMQKGTMLNILSSNITIFECMFKTDVWSYGYKIIITKCTFDSNILSIVSTFDSTISFCSFTNCPIYQYHGSGITSKITVTDNKISDTDILFDVYCECQTFIFKNNFISNVKSCVKSRYGSTITFEDNVFDNVERLCTGMKQDHVKLASNNTFIHCGDQLTNYANTE